MKIQSFLNFFVTPQNKYSFPKVRYLFLLWNKSCITPLHTNYISMRAKMAYTLINLLKKGKVYRDGRTNLFIELSYDDPHFIRYEYHGDGFNGEAHSNKTQFTEKEMFEFITQPH